MTDNNATALDVLLPCPFCNGQASAHGAEQGGYWIKCENYGRGCGVMTDPRMTMWGARATWNRRLWCAPIVHVATGPHEINGCTFSGSIGYCFVQKPADPVKADDTEGNA